MDFVGGNLLTFLGMKPINDSLDEFFSGAEKSVDKFIKETGIPNLYSIPGIRKLYKSMSLNSGLREKFIKQIRYLPFDLVIIDLGAGTHLFTLDIFSSANRGLVVVTPDAASVENALRFLKCAFYRKVERLWRKYKIHFTDEEISITNFRYPAEIIRYLLLYPNEECTKIVEEISETKWDVIVNFVRDEKDLVVGDIVKKQAKLGLGVEMKCIGSVVYIEGLKPIFNGGEPLPKKVHPTILFRAFHEFIENLKPSNEGMVL